MTDEKLFHEGDRYFDSLIRAIRGARSSIDLETYILDRDGVGIGILAELAQAAARGVRVRLLLDGFGCAQWSYSQVLPLARAGIRVRFFHPLPWQAPRLRRPCARVSLLRYALLGLDKLNRRNHRKTCTIDGQTAYLGGMNVSGRHCAVFAGAKAWRDTGIRIRGRDVRCVRRAFESAWTHARSLRQEPVPSTSTARLNVTRRQRRRIHRDLVARISRATRRVWITTPYFIPDLALLRALRQAARRGVDVRLLFPGENDVWGMKWAVASFYFKLLNGRIQIYEYQPSVLHAKITLIDDWLRVGSSNLNSRSLLHDLEIDIVLRRPSSLASVEQQFRSDMRRSKAIRLAAWDERSNAHRVFERMSLPFRRWL